MTRGGKRERAGRPLKGSSPAIPRTIRANEEDWQRIKDKAQDSGLSITEYILSKALQD